MTHIETNRHLVSVADSPKEHSVNQTVTNGSEDHTHFTKKIIDDELCIVDDFEITHYYNKCELFELCCAILVTMSILISIFTHDLQLYGEKTAFNAEKNDKVILALLIVNSVTNLIYIFINFLLYKNQMNTDKATNSILMNSIFLSSKVL